MYKNFKYILVFVLCFCMFSLNAKADDEKVYASGDCLFYFKSMNVKHSPTGSLGIRIHQTSGGGWTYYYTYKEGVDPTSNKGWEVIKDNSKSITVGPSLEYGDVSEFVEYAKKDGIYTKCPKYATLSVKDGKYNVKFLMNYKKDPDYLYYAEADSNYKLEFSNNPYSYIGKKCPSSNTISNSDSDDYWLKVPNNPSKDNGYCLYDRYTDDYGCAFLELNYTNDKIIGYSNDKISFLRSALLKEDSPVNEFIYGADLKSEMLKGGCPLYILIGVSSIVEAGQFKIDFGIFNFYTVGETDGSYYDKNTDKTFKNMQIMSLVKSNPASANTILPPEKITKKYKNCEELLGDNLVDLLNNLIKVLRILIPIILNVLGIVDFAKATFAGREDEMKKAQAKFIKRLIIGIVIFLIPSLLKLVLNVAHGIWPVIDNSLCGIID